MDTSLTPIQGQAKQSSLMQFGREGIAIQTLEQAMIFAKAVIDGGWAPRDFKTPQSVMVAIQYGAEIGLSPMGALNSIAVINGKPGVYGDAGKALLRAKGFDIEEVCDGNRATCTITHPNQKPVVRSFTVEDAKRAGLWGKPGPWQQYPTRMLMWRAFWWAARDAAAHVLKGVSGVEELRDIPPAEPKDVTPAPVTSRLSAIDAPKPVETVTTATETASGSELPFGMDQQTLDDIAASKAKEAGK